MGEVSGPALKRRFVARAELQGGCPGQMLSTVELTPGVPVQVGLTILLDDGQGRGHVPATPLRETSDGAERAVGSKGINMPSDAVSFLESDVGRRVFSWWQRGFVTSLLVRNDLGPDILEAFRGQQSVLDSAV